MRYSPWPRSNNTRRGARKAKKLEKLEQLDKSYCGGTMVLAKARSPLSTAPVKEPVKELVKEPEAEIVKEIVTSSKEKSARVSRNRFLARTEEKWELNQYWYAPSTIAMLTKEIDEHATKVAFLSTPSVWFSLENQAIKSRSFFFDVDPQWGKHANFVQWNYNHPSDIDPSMHHQFDCVVMDPPFVTHEVWAKYAEAARLLLSKGGKIILTTIPENAAMLKDMLDVTPQAFQPSVPHLVYQYNFFTNYHSTNLARLNPDVVESF